MRVRFLFFIIFRRIEPACGNSPGEFLSFSERLVEPTLQRFRWSTIGAPVNEDAGATPFDGPSPVLLQLFRDLLAERPFALRRVKKPVQKNANTQCHRGLRSRTDSVR